MKGIAAYADHAAILGYEKDDIYDFLMEAIASTTKKLSTDGRNPAATSPKSLKIFPRTR